ncbi:MAG: 4-phosphopantetheinyl transferase family protein, partial [Chloroflexi bacterium]|nr:4-phosphopantetheinyl transferase family protein [Chloroflexota bacterium]
KEAYIKATGKGLSTPLDSFEVPVVPDLRVRVLRIDLEPDAPMNWLLHEIELDVNYRAALAVEGGGCGVEYWEIAPEW